MNVLKSCAGAALTLVCVLVVAAPALAGPPTETLTVYADRLFAALDDPALKEQSRAAERHRAIRGLAEDALDFRESAKRALGTHWHARTDAERERFVRLFTDLIDQAYLTRLSRDGEQLVLDSETIDGKEATVKGRALSKGGSATPVIFSLHQSADGHWRVYDVSFEGMSLVGNYRAQFNKIIRASSFDELMTKLEAKTHGGAQASAGPKTNTQ
jgi:phospholipid transport system substrate-binding protein